MINFAATVITETSHQADLLSALGIDIKLLLLQTLAFLVLAFILGKFVYPVLNKAIEDRRDKIEVGLRSAKKAEADLKAVEHKVAGIIREARDEAGEIVARSRQEAVKSIEAAEEKAGKRAEAIVAQAQAQIDSELAAARKALQQETVKLVAQATEKIIRQKVDQQTDAGLIAAALKETK